MLDFSCSQNVSDQRGKLGKLGLFAGGAPANKSLGFQNSKMEIGNLLFVFHPQKSPPHFYVFSDASPKKYVNFKFEKKIVILVYNIIGSFSKNEAFLKYLKHLQS